MLVLAVIIFGFAAILYAVTSYSSTGLSFLFLLIPVAILALAILFFRKARARK